MKLPSLAKAKARTFAGGGIVGVTPGRADKVPLDVPPNSHVLPADVVSGLGQGNTAAGVKTLDYMFGDKGPYGAGKSGLYGGKAPKIKKPSTRQAKMKPPKPKFANGGLVPTAMSDGEYVVSPERVAAIGGGNVDLGHEILDEFIRQTRDNHIQTLSNLPGPAK